MEICPQGFGKTVSLWRNSTINPLKVRESGGAAAGCWLLLVPCAAGSGQQRRLECCRSLPGKTQEPESKPFFFCNNFRWYQRISLKTDKPNSRSTNEEKELRTS